MELIERGIYKYDDSAGETYYKVKYVHRGICIADSVRGFFTLMEAREFRDDCLDHRNIKKDELKSGKVTYRAEFYKDKKTLRKSFQTYSQAVKWRKMRRLEKTIGSILLEKCMTLSDFSQYWISNEVKVVRTKATLTTYSRLLRVYIRPHLGKLTLDTIKAHHINEFMGVLKSKKFAAATISLILSVLQRCLEFAVLNDVIGRNIMRSIDKIQGQEVEPEYWDVEDLKKFFKYMASKQSFPLFYTAAKTGMRRGELVGLRWNSVFFKKGLIRVDHTRTNNDPKLETKNKKIRRIPITTDLLELLKNLKEKNKGSRYDYVFITHKGEPYSYNSINGMFFEYQKKAKITKTISIHKLRHSFASLFAEEGGSMELLQVIMGHSNFKTTERYRHFSDDFMKTTRLIIEKTEIKS